MGKRNRSIRVRYIIALLFYREYFFFYKNKKDVQKEHPPMQWEPDREHPKQALLAYNLIE